MNAPDRVPKRLRNTLRLRGHPHMDGGSNPARPGGQSCASWRLWSKQRHTARRPAFEVRIFYPFHPRRGETVVVVGLRRHAGAEHFTVRQPDGTLALLPAWMAAPELAACELVAQPRLSVEGLADLAAFVDAFMAPCRGDSAPCKGVDHAKSARQSEGPVRRGDAGARGRAADQADPGAAGPSDGSGRSGDAAIQAERARRGG